MADIEQRQPRVGGVASMGALEISGTVMNELSGSYRQLFEAIKELVVNSYDADAERVELNFGLGYRTLQVADDGAGMTPRQFLQDYLRVGRAPHARTHSPSGRRLRVGGKGIGSLAPTRYCRHMALRTKTMEPMEESMEVIVTSSGKVQLADIFPYGALSDDLLDVVWNLRYQVVGADGVSGEPVALNASHVMDLPAGERCRVSYTFAAQQTWLRAEIDLRKVRELGASIGLSDVSGLWQVSIEQARSEDWWRCGTIIDLELEDFVVRQLQKGGSPRPRNIDERSGLHAFLWNLARACPVAVMPAPGKLESLPPVIAQHLRPDSGSTVTVFYSDPNQQKESVRRGQLHRDVHVPVAPDERLCRPIHWVDAEAGVSISGYVLASPKVIWPAELRGISVRVGGVELGRPCFFGAEDLVTGAQAAALTQHLTGEVTISGVDAGRDILPGREGLYSESLPYRLAQRLLVGYPLKPGDQVKLDGVLKELVDTVLMDSDINGSLRKFKQRLLHRHEALMSVATDIAVLTESDWSVRDRFRLQTEEPELLFVPDYLERPGGRLAAFELKYDGRVGFEDHRLDLDTRTLTLDARHKHLHLDLAGEGFTVALKHGGSSKRMSELVNKHLLVNWDHPLRLVLGDDGFLATCIGRIAFDLPEEQLVPFFRLIKRAAAA